MHKKNIFLGGLLSLFFVTESADAGNAFFQYLNKINFRSNNRESFTSSSKELNSPLTLASHGPDIIFHYVMNEEDRDKLNELLENESLFAKTESTSSGYHVIWSSVFNKNIRALKLISEKITSNRLYDIQDSFGNNLLHICCFMQWQEGIQFLIKKHDIRAWQKNNKLRKTPNDIAAKYGNSEIKRLLQLNNQKNSSEYIKKSSNRRHNSDYNDDYYANDKSFRDNNRFNKAETKDSKNFIGYDNVFFDILSAENERDLKKILKNQFSQKLDKYGNNIMHILVMFGKYDLISKIVGDFDNKRFSPINEINFLQNTPLHIAVSKNDLNTVSSLLECESINLGILNTSHTTPLMLGIRNYKEYNSEKEDAYEIIHKILSYKKNRQFNKNQLDIRDTHGNTAYHLACMQLSIKIISDLVVHGANVNMKNRNGLTGGDILIMNIKRSSKTPREEKMSAIFEAIAQVSQSGGVNESAAIRILYGQNDIKLIKDSVFN